MKNELLNDNFDFTSARLKLRNQQINKQICLLNILRKKILLLILEEVKANMPESFRKHHPNTIGIVDASEIRIERPSNVRAANLCWSSYKHNYTIKFLVVIAPDGQIIFISRAYGGRITDAQITTDTKVIGKRNALKK